MPVDEAHIARRHSRLILLSVCMGQTIVGLDQRALTVVLPTLTTTFHTPFTTIQWTMEDIVSMADSVIVSRVRLNHYRQIALRHPEHRQPN